MKPLSIVYLHAHDAGSYIQPYGHAVETPNLQRLAESGMLFRQAFCVNPTCSPSRACLLTGQSAHVNGMLGLAHRGFRLNNYDDTLIRFLKGQGWHTALSGVQHIVPFESPDTIGYDELLDRVKVEGSENERRYPNSPVGVTEAAEDFLAREHDKPFFLDVGYFPPHRIGEDGDFPRMFDPPNPAYVRPPAHLPDNEATRKDYAKYLASVKTFDALAGRVFDAIERHGHAENTLVIATTDHGIAFPGMKCRLTDHGLKVMMILRGPNGFLDGKCTDAMVSHLDVFPTICDVLDLPLPERCEGKSLCALAEEPSSQLRDCVFAEVNVHAAYEPMRAVRTERYKYIRHYEQEDHVVLPNVDNGPTKGYLCDHDWAQHVPAAEELYDLIFDPLESRNLSADPEHADALQAMRDRLDTWMHETNDPLLAGSLDVSDKIITPSDVYSPSGKPRPE